MIPDPLSAKCVYIAESAGCVRRIDVEVGEPPLYVFDVNGELMRESGKARESTAVYKGPVAPLTSVAVGGANASTVFAVCWDKDVWSWERESQQMGRRYKGHSDFVKAVICVKLSGKDVSTLQPTFESEMPANTSPDFDKWWSRQEDHSLGYNNWRANTYLTRPGGNNACDTIISY